jgi:hypothetical protein
MTLNSQPHFVVKGLGRCNQQGRALWRPSQPVLGERFCVARLATLLAT